MQDRNTDHHATPDSFAEKRNEKAQHDMPLTSLADNESATVSRIECERPVRRRLMEMGLLPGTRVTLLGTAPLGDPIRLALREYVLSLRKHEARAIYVTRTTIDPL